MFQRIKQICAAALLVCIGCSSTPTDESSATQVDDGMQPMSMEASMPGDSAAGSGPVIINSVTPAPGSQQVPPAPPVQTTTAPGMNPPHGQPGHRCEIAVGAPLNSAPTAPPTGQPMGQPTAQPMGSSPATATPIMSTPSGSGQMEIKPVPPPGLAMPPGAATAPAATTPPPAPGKTPPGMNPPHGEPGHDCSIAVGAPLKK